MKLYVFSVHDVKAGSYLPPFFVPNPPVAMRTFSNCANDKTHSFGANPEDYTLFLVGTWDSDSCLFSLAPTPEPMGKALDFVRVSVVPNGSKLS